MAALLLFGASRGTGFELIKFALKQGHRCIAVVRNAQRAEMLKSLGASVFIGDANDPDIVEQACLNAGSDCTIISTLGGKLANYQAQLNIIEQAEKSSISRMLLVTSLGCGDSWKTLSDRAKSAFGLSVREKTLAEVWLQTSKLEYCILRPGGLVDGEPTHNAKCYANQEVHGYVTRSDLALILFDKAMNYPLGHQIYSVVDPDLVVERSYPQS